MSIELRDYQEEAVKALLGCERGIVKAPCGSGKTVILAAAIDRWLEKHPNVANGFDMNLVLWVAHTKEQCEQAESALKYFPKALDATRVHCYQGEPCANEYDLAVFDEVHHVASPEFRKILEGYTRPRWGCSATPERADDLKDDVFKLVGPIVYDVERAGLVESGKLVKAHVYFHAPNEHNECFDPIEKQAKEGAAAMECSVAYNAAIMANKPLSFVARMIGKKVEAENLVKSMGFGTAHSVSMLLKLLIADDCEKLRGWLKDAVRVEFLSRARWHGCQQLGIFGNGPRNKKIIELASKHSENSVLILVGSIEHGKLLQVHIPGSVVMYSKMGATKRRDAMTAFRDGSLKCVISTSLFDEGADCPRADVLILTSAGRSAGKSEQRTGRVLRAWGEKVHGTVIDFWDRQHPMLLAQSKARAKVYAGLDYEFCANELTPDVLKAIGITSHAAISDGKTVKEKKYARSAAKKNAVSIEEDALVNGPDVDDEIISEDSGCINPKIEVSSPALEDSENKTQDTGWSSQAARLAHNQEVTGSIPVPVTISTPGCINPEPGLPSPALEETGLNTSPGRVAEPVTDAPQLNTGGTTPGQENLAIAGHERGQANTPLEDGLELRNGGQSCDMKFGPCACGAWHKSEDWEWRLLNQRCSPVISPPGGCINPTTTNDITTTSSEHGITQEPPTVGGKTPDSGLPVLAHSDRSHSRLSPSSLKSKAICSGFRNDPNSDKTAANRGTLGHECAEKEDTTLAGEDAVLALAAQLCIDYKNAIKAQAREYARERGVELIVVQESKLLYFDQWGFCDELYVAGNKAWLLDWKFAFNFYPADIPQFHAYSVGTWDRYAQVEDIEVHVGHPFLNKTDVEIFNRVLNYDEFRLSIKAVMAKVKLNRPEDYRVTEQCVYCGFSSECAKLANLGLEIGRRYAPEMVLPVGPVHGSQVTDPADMAALHGLASIMERAAEGWRKAGLAMHDAGKPLPGFKVCTRAGKRIITNPAEAFRIYKANFRPDITPEQFLKECSLGATTMDALVSATAPDGKKKGAVANLTALLTDANVIKHGAGSRFLIAD
jgi:superfamily II DNA or RNA helicase